MIVVTYTHTNSFDVVPYYIKRMDRYNTTYKNLFFSNAKIDDVVCYLYNDTNPYSVEYSKLLKQLDDEFIIYSQEDQILYNDIDHTVLNNIKNFLEKSEYHYCRLIRQQKELECVCDNMYLSNNNFSMQPTIWKRTSLIEIMDSVIVDKIFDESKFDVVMSSYPGLFYYDGSKKRGLEHYDSNIWPYIATAIVKGKWNTSEYGIEIGELFNEYDIKTSRGFR